MSDSPETRSKHRRNLMLLSTLFFLYVATGTSVSDLKDVRVYFISAEITRPEVLIYFAWLLLVWYFYRFWLSHRGYQAISQITNAHLNQNNVYKEYFLKEVIKENPNLREPKIESTKPIRKNTKYSLETNRVLERKEHKSSWNDAEGVSKTLEVTFFTWHYLVGRHFVRVSLSKSPEFWDSLFPYIFSISAMLVGIWRAYSERCI